MPNSLHSNEKEVLPIPNGHNPAKCAPPTDSRSASLTTAQLSLLVLVIQNSTLVLMMRCSRVRKSPDQMYIASTAVFLAEILKIIACLIVLLIQKRTLKRFINVIQKDIFEQPTEIIKMIIPSALYALQNNLLYVALSNLEAATFQVTYQLKILSTAIFSVLMLGRSLSRGKWFALVLLMVGVTLVQLQTVNHHITASSASDIDIDKNNNQTINLKNHNDEDPTSSTITVTSKSSTATATHILMAAQNPLIGLIAVITSCISSGFAGCYFEKVLKSSDTSMWVRNIQLGFSGSTFSVLAMILYDGKEIFNDGFFQGYNSLTFAVVGNQALGGLLVAMVVKYADNILKGFATSVSIIVSGIISFYFLNFQPSSQFTIVSISADRDTRLILADIEAT
ncbi:6652_t:CDS:2 [Ambispora gerdemannii]|uniref:6652_t:CDS:1 n=1 Tax=Ambispora gerdemannii TaxID=144530 RepID=A0A9N8VEY7_9GLOM|nr:6652_t:CDS:2 [Ambispora gerdemannii]